MYIENSTFKDNYAEDYGGAIYADAVNINVNQAYPQAFSSFFINNKAGDNKGGAIYADSVCINVFQSSQAFNSFFINNKAGDNKGGAIYVDDGDLIANTVFSGNKAKVDGGAINGDDNVAVTHCLFENNRAEGASVMSCYGGAFCAHENAYVAL